LLSQLCRDGKLADKTVLRYYLLLPIAFNFTLIPLCRNISTAQVVSLARRQVLYRRSCQPNSRVDWKRDADLVKQLRLNGTGVDGEDLDLRILYKIVLKVRRSIRIEDETMIFTNGNKLCKTKHCVLRDAVLALVWASKLGRA
jgi:hypothetical protein